MGSWIVILLFSTLTSFSQVSRDSIVKILVPEVIVRTGSHEVIHVYVAIKKGYHIQANQVNDEFLIPTTLELDEQELITSGKQSYPAAKRFVLEGSNQVLMVYDGKFKISIPFDTNENIKMGKYTLEAKLHYQACDS